MSTRAATGFIIAIASALAACASTAPDTVEETSAPLATNSLTVNPGNRYQLVGEKDGENYYCQKQPRTGSRANSKVSCVNQQMFEAYSKVGQDPTIQGPRSGGTFFGGSQ